MKYLKTSQLSQIKKENDDVEKDGVNIEKSNLKDDENFENDFKDSFNLKISQERWKEETIENI
jgi:hypothetical protein